MAVKKQIKEKSHLNEPVVAYKVMSKAEMQVRSVFRDIGNSKGVIISRKMMEVAGFHHNNVIIEASEGEIRIRSIDEQMVNTDLSSWGKQFASAINAGQKPDADMFNGMKNSFDDEEW